MIRVRCSLIILQVAADTGISAEVVIVVEVAIGALARRNGMHSGQRKIRRIVVERSI